MIYATSLIAAIPLFAGLAQAATSTMGHAGFTWPTPRAWSDTSDQSSPCGAEDGVGERTKFPLTNGAVALQINDEAFKVNMAISYNENPSVNGDFVNIVDYTHFPVIDPGNECYSVPDPLSRVLSGQKATLQLSYAALESGRYRTFYACADIVFVPLSQFTETISCYNYSSETGVKTSNPGVAPTPASTSSKHKLTAGAIAGIVVGIAVFFMLAALAFLFRTSQRVKRAARITENHLRLQALRRDPDTAILKKAYTTE
ncbi:hypothetical protein SCUCBS95973_000567 [Sporothrix curviconia]|uniref:Copper acquisition factor BIM1-like domain-containing protein n=1 Tax=Sporothrix curviconia TaxID=1260050 RepID=A0ABP0ARL6_9PEZI